MTFYLIRSAITVLTAAGGRKLPKLVLLRGERWRGWSRISRSRTPWGYSVKVSNSLDKLLQDPLSGIVLAFLRFLRRR